MCQGLLVLIACLVLSMWVAMLLYPFLWAHDSLGRYGISRADMKLLKDEMRKVVQEEVGKLRAANEARAS